MTQPPPIRRKPLTSEELKESIEKYTPADYDRDFFNIWTTQPRVCCGQGDCNRCQFPHKHNPNQ